MTQADLRKMLIQGLAQMGLDMDPEPLLIYVNLLQKWNQAYNLTAIRSSSDMVSLHILDSLAIVPHIRGKNIADIGSGAGFPGIPLALFFPNKKVVLFESLGKKVRFLETVIRSLKLSNVEVAAMRAEHYQGEETFDTVTSRALTSLAQFMEWTHHLISNQGRWVAMKGRRPDDELAVLTHPYTLHTYQVPGVQGERCVVCFE
jgi:16S rRNA (guanine527-N7)-methyltransferase